MGWSFLNFRAPVRAFARDDTAGGDIWYIQGGLSNNEIDMGTPDSPGGGLVLNVGNAMGIRVDHAY